MFIGWQARRLHFNFRFIWGGALAGWQIGSRLLFLFLPLERLKYHGRWDQICESVFLRYYTTPREQTSSTWTADLAKGGSCMTYKHKLAATGRKSTWFARCILWYPFNAWECSSWKLIHTWRLITPNASIWRLFMHWIEVAGCLIFAGNSWLLTFCSLGWNKIARRFL